MQLHTVYLQSRLKIITNDCVDGYKNKFRELHRVRIELPTSARLTEFSGLYLTHMLLGSSHL